ncbi:hypothetical protein, partial [Shouchella rhizosphaerae]|uniref:hypothetical protein n=1 Tax=Shouchella rhizosphaerae TaxID=866786 RepID=UPI00203AE4D8
EENGGSCPPSFTEIPIYPNKGESRSSQISTPLLHFKGFWDNLTLFRLWLAPFILGRTLLFKRDVTAMVKGGLR